MKIKPNFETEIFINEPGYVAIRQDDEIVQLAPNQISLVITALQEFLNSEEDWWWPTENPPADQQAAPASEAEAVARLSPVAKMKEFERFVSTANDEMLARLNLKRTEVLGQ